MYTNPGFGLATFLTFGPCNVHFHHVFLLLSYVKAIKNIELFASHS